jgi:hypothetical protein
MSVITRATWRNIPEDGILHCHHRENLKSYTHSKLHEFTSKTTLLYIPLLLMAAKTGLLMFLKNHEQIQRWLNGNFTKVMRNMLMFLDKLNKYIDK